MIKAAEYEKACNKAIEMIRRVGIAVSENELNNMDAADFGLNDLYAEGAQMLELFNTHRISAKVIVLFAGQTLPEHWHDKVGDDPGKEEIIRAAYGKAYVYLPGSSVVIASQIPKGKGKYYTSRKEFILTPGEQIVLSPGIKHWIQAGVEGAVLYSFSTCARDELDKFSDPAVIRKTLIEWDACE